MSERWCRGVRPLRVEIDCNGERHTVLWRRGSVALVDHDVGAETVVAALGGEPPACLDVLRSWRMGYVEAERPAAVEGLVRPLSSLARWMSGSGPAPVRLPEPLRRLREASISATWARGLREPHASAPTSRSFRDRAVARRIKDLLTEQLASQGVTDVDIVVVMATEPALTGRVESGRAVVRATVPASWLTEVWVRGHEWWDGEVVLSEHTDRLEVAHWEPDGAGWTLSLAETSPFSARLGAVRTPNRAENGRESGGGQAS